MKDGYRATVSTRKKAVKKRKRISKNLAPTGIAQQYLELQRLRELVSEVESWRAMR
jgi:hypothetical protein